MWEPPTVAIQIAMEELQVAQIKREESTHDILCPKADHPNLPLPHAKITQFADCSASKEGHHAKVLVNLDTSFLTYLRLTLKLLQFADCGASKEGHHIKVLVNLVFYTRK